MHVNPFTPAEGKGTQQLLHALPSLHQSLPSASSQHQSLLPLNHPRVPTPPLLSPAHRAVPPQQLCRLSCKSYQTSKNEVGTIKHFADGKYVLHLFRKSNRGRAVAVYLCPLRKLLFWVFSHASVLVVEAPNAVSSARRLLPTASRSDLLVSEESWHRAGKLPSITSLKHPPAKYSAALTPGSRLHSSLLSISQCEWFLLFYCPGKQPLFIFVIAWWCCRAGHHPTERRQPEAPRAHASSV